MAHLTQNRRELLLAGGAFGALLGLRPLLDVAVADDAAEQGTPFSYDFVRKRAEELASADFVAPAVAAEAPFDALSAAQFQDIRIRPEATVWRGEKLEFEIQTLPFGWIYNVPVEISIVEGGKSIQQVADGKSFAFGPSFEKVPEEAPFGFSGFRVLGPLNRADWFEEYVTFQGASYFRAVGRGQVFGLSARGLALNTAQAAGEEFPVFRAFWIERPKSGGHPLTVYALLDCPSVSGAYRFRIQPGADTQMDVDATLYPRRELPHVGLAPLTSMYLHGSAGRRITGDARSAVHNSEGLAIINGKGERLWRPVTNPKTLQTSAFMDSNPRGFGLVQRDRAFSSYDDIDARFELRPTVWVEPQGGWGPGYIELIEIPADDQIHDNIVAYWKPAKALEAGKPFTFAYRLTWGAAIPKAWAPARVRKTRVGNVRNGDETREVFIVDFEGDAIKPSNDMPRADVAASAGNVANISVARHPELNGVRVRFELAPADAETIELRLGLRSGEDLISESWLYRWTRS